MDIENDPRLTAYALGELGEDERQIFEQELTNAGGATGAIASVRQWAELLREAYSAEPVYAMSDAQRAALLADAGALPEPIPIEEEIQHSDKILPWVTQPVISEVDKQKIAEALKPSPWKQLAPILGSVGAAAAVIWLAAVVLTAQKPKPGEVATANDSPAEEALSEPMVITITPPARPGAREGIAVSLPGLERPFLYGDPLEPLPGVVSSLPDDLFDPTFRGYRRAEVPIIHEGESLELLRQYLADGMLPPADAIFAEELINAYDYAYAAPAEGKTFAVDTEVADCPWDPDRQLLQVGVRAAEGEEDTPVAESVAMAVEFNPETVAGYRRIGELSTDPLPGAVDGTTVASGQSVTALYEVLPRAEVEVSAESGVNADELVTVRVDYKEPKKGEYVAGSVLATVAGVPEQSPWRDASDDFRFAASVAGFGMLLGAPNGGSPATYDLILDLARNALGKDPAGERKEFVELVEKSKRLELTKEGNLAPEENVRFTSPPKKRKGR